MYDNIGLAYLQTLTSLESRNKNLLAVQQGGADNNKITLPGPYIGLLDHAQYPGNQHKRSTT
jgi:hypothetical protein